MCWHLWSLHLILVDLALCYLWMASNEATLIDITEIWMRIESNGMAFIRHLEYDGENHSNYKANFTRRCHYNNNKKNIENKKDCKLKNPQKTRVLLIVFFKEFIYESGIKVLNLSVFLDYASGHSRTVELLYKRLYHHNLLGLFYLHLIQYYYLTECQICLFWYSTYPLYKQELCCSLVIKVK